jgi:hypothetical protein
MRSTILAIALSAALVAAGCMKKQADGTYKPVNPVASGSDAQRAHDNAAKSGDELKGDLRDIAAKLKEDAHKIRDSENTKRAREKAGDTLERAGEKLKEAGAKTKEKARQ